MVLYNDHSAPLHSHIIPLDPNSRYLRLILHLSVALIKIGPCDGETEENMTGLFVFLYPWQDEKNAVKSEVVGSLCHQK